MSRNGRVQAIDRAIMILNCFSVDRRELKLSEISDMLDINKSTVHGIISTLRFHGLIDQDEESQKYRLGIYLMALGERVSNSLDIIGLSKPYINEICKEVEETVHLGTLDGMDVVYIDKIESNQSMRIITSIGTRKPAHCTGIGKVMLAHLNTDKIVEMFPDELERYTPNTIVDKLELIEELSRIKKRGYSYDNEENNIGLTCLAAPIFDYTGKAKYGISVSGPTIRMDSAKVEEVKRMLLDVTREISLQLGYKG